VKAAWSALVLLACGCSRPPLDRVSDARRELGATTHVAVVAGVFVVAHTSGFRDAYVEEDRALLSRAYGALRRDAFRTPPEKAVGVYLFPSWLPYDEFCSTRWGERCASPYGFYARGERLIVIDMALGEGTLTHEMVHPMVEADFPGAPTWLDEGLASLFEAPTFDAAGNIHGRTNWRLRRLLTAIADDRTRPLVRIDRLFGMTSRAFRADDEVLSYALARYLCQWLDERGQLWAFYRRFRDDRAGDPDGRRAFLMVTGETPTEAQAAWKAWLESLPLPS